MADNRLGYGFRWSVGANGGRPEPSPIEMIVASAESFDVNGGAANVGLGAGDPVKLLSTGTVTLCDGSEGAGGALKPWGIVVGVGPYYDAAKGVMTYGNVLPSDTTWGTVQARRSTVLVVPVQAGIWEVDCDDTSIGTTEASYVAAAGLNVDHILCGASGETRAKPRLDASSAAAATATLIWQILGISKTQHNTDFSGSYVKLLVRCNNPQFAPAGVAGI
jgi:hypothetical protein